MATIIDTVQDAEKRARELGVPLEELVAAASVHRTTWARWRSGEATPRWENWRKVVRKLAERERAA